VNLASTKSEEEEEESFLASLGMTVRDKKGLRLF
jgi:hypothetical protein